MVKLNKIYRMDALEGLKSLPDESVDMVLTSPPYWGLRDYGDSAIQLWDADPRCAHTWDASWCTKCQAWRGQLGWEPDFRLYLKHLLDIFEEVRRVLKNSGTCWVNLADTYAGSWGNYAPGGIRSFQRTRTKRGARWGRPASPPESLRPSSSYPQPVPRKSLCLIPFRFATQMVERDWILRNTIIWQKSNAIPSSVRDRFSVDFEYFFFFAKSSKYHFKRQYENAVCTHPSSNGYRRPQQLVRGGRGNSEPWTPRPFRSKRCVWTIPVKPRRELHVAAFPKQLAEIPIKAGCPQGGVVLDLFMGSGTTAVVTRRLGRNFIGFEVNPDYIKAARARLKQLSENEHSRHANAA
jgi:site-specific DNA-methyltransferase (cytosine-N4-specific)